MKAVFDFLIDIYRYDRLPDNLFVSLRRKLAKTIMLNLCKDDMDMNFVEKNGKNGGIVVKFKLNMSF